MKRIITGAVLALTLLACTKQQQLQGQWDDLSEDERARSCAVYRSYYGQPTEWRRQVQMLIDSGDFGDFTVEDVTTFMGDHC